MPVRNDWDVIERTEDDRVGDAFVVDSTTLAALAAWFDANTDTAVVRLVIAAFFATVGTIAAAETIIIMVIVTVVVVFRLLFVAAVGAVVVFSPSFCRV